MICLQDSECEKARDFVLNIRKSKVLQAVLLISPEVLQRFLLGELIRIVEKRNLQTSSLLLRVIGDDQLNVSYSPLFFQKHTIRNQNFLLKKFMATRRLFGRLGSRTSPWKQPSVIAVVTGNDVS